jgi:Domain of unknown function (DUF1707)
MGDRPELRASDAERERTVEHLRDQALVGRLTVDELDERCARAYGARYVSELAELVSDLPARPPARRPDAQPLPALGPPGVRPFTYEAHYPVEPGKAMEEAIRHIAPTLHRQRYELVDRTDTRLAFTYSYRPGWTYLVAIALPPVGWVALFHTAEERVVIELEPDRRRGGTRMIVSGNAPKRVRRAFAQLLEP